MKFSKTDKGKTYTVVGKGLTVFVTKTDPWRRPSSAFTWDARCRGHHASGPTATAAVEHLIPKLKKALPSQF